MCLAAPRASTQAYRHILAVSDIHTDHALNMQWAERLPTSTRDILIVAGDVSDRLETFEETMSTLAQRFGLVFFVPGNHDLWVTQDGSEGGDSVDKLRRLHEVCERHGVLRLSAESAELILHALHLSHAPPMPGHASNLEPKI